MNRRRTGLSTAARLGLLGALAALAAACGGSTTPTTPTPTTPVVSTVTPPSGTTFGGTEVTISGQRFAAGATVMMGGTAAVNVTVVDAGTIKATTPAHASGNVDVTVMGSTGSGVLPQGFMFVAPTGTNTPPVIKSLTVKGRRVNEPSAFADLSETVDVTAVVEDAETSVDKLTFQWSATAGTFSGSGPVVTWTAPASGSTPTNVTLTLTVIEAYKAADPTGLPVDKENKVSTTSTVSLHNSSKEVANMAEDFLVAFSHSDIGPEQVLRDFDSSCLGRPGSEYSDVVFNRTNFQITGYSIGAASVTVNFGGTCPFRSRLGDACAQVPSSWTSTDKRTNTSGTVKGTDQVTAYYINQRWWLCDSDYDVIDGLTSGLRFKK